MQYFYKINQDGEVLDFYLLDTHPVLDEVDNEGNSLIDPLYVSTPIPNNLYFGEEIKPKWDFETEQWVEGATPEEIAELTKPQLKEPTAEERIDELENTILMLLMM